MEKRISLNKIPKDEKDSIIKIRSKVKALIEEVEDIDMNQDKAPKWFEEFANKQEKFNNDVKTFINKQEKFNKTISNRINKLEEYHK